MPPRSPVRTLLSGLALCTACSQSITEPLPGEGDVEPVEQPGEDSTAEPAAAPDASPTTGDEAPTPTPQPVPTPTPARDAGDATVEPDPPMDAPIDGSICEAVDIRLEPLPRDALILLDRSASMADEGRWEPSKAAVKSVTAQLDSQFRFGLWMFPQAPGPSQCTPVLDPGCDIGADRCKPGELSVPFAAASAAPIASTLDAAVSDGGTPTGPALDGVRELVLGRGPDIDPPVVLLVTDGPPTCPAGAAMDTNQADIIAAREAMDALTAIGVTTYVLGYDTANDGELASFLDDLAQRGGSGDTAHRPVEDEGSLIQALEDVTAQSAACSFELQSPVDDPAYARVTLDGTSLPLGEPDGWVMDGAVISLQGAACETMRSGGDHVLTMQLVCDAVEEL